MSIESEATVEQFETNNVEAETSQDRDWRKWSVNIAATTGFAALAINALGSRGIESARQLSHAQDLSEISQLAVHSGAHPILGFVSGLSARLVAEKAADAGRKAYVYLAVGMVGTAAVDIGVEFGQDAVLNDGPLDMPFYAAQNIPETTRDMGAALFGFAVAAAINWPRRSGETEAAR